MKQTFIHKSLELEVTSSKEVIEKTFFSDKDDHEVVAIWLDYDKNEPNGDGTLGFFIADTEVLPYEFPSVFLNCGILNLNPEQVKHTFRETALGAQLCFMYRDASVVIAPVAFVPYKVRINLVFARYNEALPSMPEYRTRYFLVTLAKNDSRVTMQISRFKAEYFKLIGVTAARCNSTTMSIQEKIMIPAPVQIAEDTLQIKIGGQELFLSDYPVELYSINTQKGMNQGVQELDMLISHDSIELMYQYGQPVSEGGIYLLFKCLEKR